MCGEKVSAQQTSNYILGSPPRVRGKVFYNSNVCTHAGITPACAGKRTREKEKRRCAWDHPRVCGEKLVLGQLAARGIGSPPRVRGKGRQIVVEELVHGITPACAGKSCPSRRQSTRRGGSPPRVRGKGRIPTHIGALRRITPACAGKSLIHEDKAYLQ